MFDAKLVLNQLATSTGRLVGMVGAKSFIQSAEEMWVSFRHMKGANGINCTKIHYNAGLDLYNIEYMRIHGTSVKTIKTSENLYADMLREDFERETKLYLSL